MKRSLCILALLLLANECRGQFQPWAVQWLQKAYSPCAGRQYLGVTNLYAGSNVTFRSNGPCDFYIDVSGTLTNTSISTNSIYAQYATNWLGSNAFYVLILGSTNAWSTNALYSLWSTNWAGSNAMWIIMTNLIYNATNGFVAQTNIYATNLIGLLEGTNITFTTNASGYLSINGASGTGPTILDIRTNAFNYFLGTNSFTNDVYAAWNQAYLGAPTFTYGGAKWGLGCTNVQSTAFLPYAGVIRALPSGHPNDVGGRYLGFGISDNFATLWFDDAFTPNLIAGVGWSARSENDGVEKALTLAGSPVAIGSRTTANSAFYIMQINRPAAGLNAYGNWFVGRSWGADAQLFGTGAGGVFATNFMHTIHYNRARRGFVVNSNSWATLAWNTPPNFQISGSSDSFSYGDTWMLSSNGVPTFVWKDIAGTVHTNQVGVDTVGVTITQHVYDFFVGSITNVYSNGLLVATGDYIVPMIAAGGDVMLGAFGETLEPADTL